MNFEEEKKDIESAVMLSRERAESMQELNKENKRLWVLLGLSWVVIAIMAISMFVYSHNMQQTFTNALMEAMQQIGEFESTTETITTTTTETAEGETVTINNVDGEQYNDSAQKVGDGE